MRRVVLCFALLLYMLTGCAADNTNTQIETPSIKDNPLFEVYVSALSLQGDGEMAEKVICVLDQPSQVTEIMLMFNGWNPDENKANDTIDGWPNYRIHFGNKLSISYFYPGKSLGYVCLIDGTYYLLPEAFGQYIDGLIAEINNRTQ